MSTSKKNANTTAKPQWVPDWVWSDYQAFVDQFGRMAELLEYGRGETLVGSARRLVHDRDCSRVWMALERRADVFQERWEKRQVGLPEGVRRGYPSAALDLFVCVGWASLGPRQHQLVKSADREKIGRKIADLTLQLQSELHKIGEMPPEIEEKIDAMIQDARIAFVRDREQARRNSEPEAIFEPIGGADAHFAAGFNYAATGEFFPTAEYQWPVLSALRAGAMDWVASAPLFYRPGDSNVVCQYTALKVHQLFMRNYGQPLWDSIADVSCALFDPGMAKDGIVALVGRRK